MKTKMIKFSTVILLFLFIGAGCEKEEPPETDFAKIILGKWECVELGNYPNMLPIEDPLGYEEYLPDSILREYNYETGKYFYKKYWIDSTILTIGFYLPDGSVLPLQTYTYNFKDKNNTLELATYQMPSIFNNSVFKRIK